MDTTVAIVAYEAAGCIGDCLDSLLQLQSHGGELEILVVDGCSGDATPDIVRRYGDRVRLISNPGRTIASNRNVALREAKSPWIAFTDADCVVPVYWLATLAREFERLQTEDPRVAGVGGGNQMRESRQQGFPLALDVALNSFLGSLGSVQGRRFTRQRPVGSLAGLNVLYRREALTAVGGFDEELRNMCEDADINYRLGRTGWHMYFIPDVEVEHRARPTLTEWCRNMLAYGRGRARIMRKHKTIFRPVYLLPVLFMPVLLAATALGFVWPWAFAVWLYVPCLFLAGCGLALKANRVGKGPLVGFILLATQACYAVGLWQGFFKGYDGNLTLPPE